MGWLVKVHSEASPVCNSSFSEWMASEIADSLNSWGHDVPRSSGDGRGEQPHDQALRPDTNPSCSSHQDPLTTRFKETHFSIVFKCLYYDENKCVKKRRRGKREETLKNCFTCFQKWCGSTVMSKSTENLCTPSKLNTWLNGRNKGWHEVCSLKPSDLEFHNVPGNHCGSLPLTEHNLV